MSNIKLIDDIYRPMMATAGLVVDADGYVSVKQKDKNRPATIGGKRLVLPTPAQLKVRGWDERVAFHPLWENIMHGESKVLAEYRNALNNRINAVTGALMLWLLRTATSVKAHPNLSPEQAKFLSKVKGADETTLESLTEIMEKAMPVKGLNKFVRIFLKKSGEYQGKRMGCVAVVTFPFYEEVKAMTKGHRKIWDITVRAKEREILMALMEFIFPTIAEEESYNRGSNNKTAQKADALMQAVLGIAADLNSVISLFANLIPDHESLMIPADWSDALSDMDMLLPVIRTVPMQAGNEGESAVPRDLEEEVEAPVATGRVSAQVQTQAEPARHTVRMQDVDRYGRPVYNTPYAGQQQQPQYQPPPVERSSRGVKFNSVLRSNPAAAAAAGVGMGHDVRTPTGRPEPRWASGGQPAYGGGGGQPRQYGGYGQNRGGFGSI
jgi:hypothetical protein